MMKKMYFNFKKQTKTTHTTWNPTWPCTDETPQSLYIWINFPNKTTINGPQNKLHSSFGCYNTNENMWEEFLSSDFSLIYFRINTFINHIIILFSDAYFRKLVVCIMIWILKKDCMFKWLFDTILKYNQKDAYYTRKLIVCIIISILKTCIVNGN